MDRYAEAVVDGERVRVVNPLNFYAAPTADPLRGQGLFCRVGLVPGDCWWAHNFDDRRYVTRVIAWADYESMSDLDKREVERLCYIDAASRSLVACAEPFCRVNHAGKYANSTTDDSGCSIVTRPIPAGTEITIPYDYDPVLSILWKFPHLREALTKADLANEALMFGTVEKYEAVRRFLEEL